MVSVVLVLLEIVYSVHIDGDGLCQMKVQREDYSEILNTIDDGVLIQRLNTLEVSLLG